MSGNVVGVGQEIEMISPVMPVPGKPGELRFDVGDLGNYRPADRDSTNQTGLTVYELVMLTSVVEEEDEIVRCNWRPLVAEDVQVGARLGPGVELLEWFSVESETNGLLRVKYQPRVSWHGRGRAGNEVEFDLRLGDLTALSRSSSPEAAGRTFWWMSFRWPEEAAKLSGYEPRATFGSSLVVQKPLHEVLLRWSDAFSRELSPAST